MDTISINPAGAAFHIGFAVTTLGQILVAKSEKGLSASLLGDDQRCLRRQRPGGRRACHQVVKADSSVSGYR